MTESTTGLIGKKLKFVLLYYIIINYNIYLDYIYVFIL